MSWPEAIFGCVVALVMGVIFWKAMGRQDDDA